MEVHRHTYYRLIHHGIKSLLADRLGHFTEIEYHQYLNVMTGKSSCFAMSDEELKLAVDNLRNEGYLEDLKRHLYNWSRKAQPTLIMPFVYIVICIGLGLINRKRDTFIQLMV